MTTKPPSSDVPLSRGIILHSHQRAVRELRGEDGLAEARDRLPVVVVAETFGPEFLPLRWYPSSHLVAWHRAILEGPAKHDDAYFTKVIERSLELSMSLIRRAFMRVLTPATLVAGAASVWRDFHTHGDLVLDQRGERSVRSVLSGHPFVDDPVSRKVVVVMAHYMAARSRAKDVRMTHSLDGAGRLVMEVTWRTGRG